MLGKGKVRYLVGKRKYKFQPYVITPYAEFDFPCLISSWRVVELQPLEKSQTDEEEVGCVLIKQLGLFKVDTIYNCGNWYLLSENTDFIQIPVSFKFQK